MSTLRYVEALEEYKKQDEKKTVIFMAGGITNCPDWQNEIMWILDGMGMDNLVLLNPRRKNFPIGDPDASYDQIKWEFDNLRAADAILFWFPKET